MLYLAFISLAANARRLDAMCRQCRPAWRFVRLSKAVRRIDPVGPTGSSQKGLGPRAFVV
jgi:hypothetical protein